MKTSSLPAGKPTRAQADPKGDAEHLVVCRVCGQIFDGHDQIQVSHHAQALHEPLVT